jgi:hypothetical protein
MKKATLEQIVNNRDLWNQYVDPDGNEPQSFEQSKFDKAATVAALWPDDMTDEDREYLFDVKLDAVAAMVATGTGAENDTQLGDWMREGHWQDMTPEAIAAEWDELNEQIASE